MLTLDFYWMFWTNQPIFGDSSRDRYILSPSCWRSPRTFNRGHRNSPGLKKVTKNRLCIARILFFHFQYERIHNKWLAFVPLYIPILPIHVIIYTNYQGQLVTASFFLFEVPQTHQPHHATGRSTYGPSISWCQKVVTWQSCWWPYWDGENVTLSKTYLVGGWVSNPSKKTWRKSNWIMFIHFP